MAKSVGIDVGDYAVKAVELDGSYKKTRLVSCRLERISGVATDTDARAAAGAAVVASMLREARMSGDKVLGHPCREAVLRTIDVPFRGAEKIRQIIKSEVESAIHSHAVDDMVVDFHEIGGGGGDGARVLVAAVPKPGLRSVLDALAGEGVEPERVDLDTMALYRVADWCGAFRAPDAAEVAESARRDHRADAEHDEVAIEDEAEPMEARPALPAAAGARSGEGLVVVVDLGARSTRLLLVEGGRLVDMRTLRIGDAAIAEAVARAHELPFDLAREAVHSCLASGADFRTEVGAALPAPVDDEPAAKVPAVAARRVTVDAAAVASEQAAFLQRLSREFMRFLASANSSGAIAALWITGGAAQMSGMSAMLREVFGVAPQTLDVVGQLKHSLSSAEVEEIGPHLAIAVGLALANVGGPVGFDFRREDLAYTRGFDRIKSALAIACMLALFAAIVFGTKLNYQLRNIEYRVGLTYTGPDADPKKAKFYGQLWPVFRSNFIQDARYFQFEDGGKKQYSVKDLQQDLLAMPVEDRIRFVRDKTRRALELKQKESGIYEEVSLESGLAVLVRYFEVLKRAEPNMGKYLLASLDLNMRSSSGGGHSGRFLQCRFAFRGDDFRERFAALRTVIEEECGRPGSPFEAIDERVGGDVPFRDGAVKGVTGAYYDLKIHIRESFAPFGVGQ